MSSEASKKTDSAAAAALNPTLAKMGGKSCELVFQSLYVTASIHTCFVSHLMNGRSNLNTRRLTVGHIERRVLIVEFHLNKFQTTSGWSHPDEQVNRPDWKVTWGRAGTTWSKGFQSTGHFVITAVTEGRNLLCTKISRASSRIRRIQAVRKLNDRNIEKLHFSMTHLFTFSVWNWKKLTYKVLLKNKLK